MSFFPDIFYFNGNITTNYYTACADCQGYAHIYAIVYSNDAYTFSIDWSVDSGINTDYQDTVVGIAGDTKTISVPIRARWAKLTFLPTGSQIVRFSAYLNPTAPGLHALENIGSGAEIYKKSVNGVRSVVSSDATITITEGSTEIDLTASGTNVTLSSAGGTETLVNDGTGPLLATKGLSAGTGISLSSNSTSVTITNAAPDQTIVLSAGSGISISGSYPNFTITAMSPAAVLYDTQVINYPSGTWTKPADFVYANILLIGAGGGGGSGRKSAAANQRSSSGGAGGETVYWNKVFDETIPAASYLVTVGAGGTGGAGQSTDSTNGNAGTNGGDTTFGSLFIARGGAGGAAGSANNITTVTPGAKYIDGTYGYFSDSIVSQADQASASALFGGALTCYYAQASTGTPGTSYSSGTTYHPLNAATYYEYGRPVTAGAVAPVANGAGTNGVTYRTYFGGGGTGSYATSGSTAYAGGNGGNFGGGGGGSHIGENAVRNSGNGGNGANGICVVYSYKYA